ncbi:MAG: FHA domain-containing protein [Myxococcota bacterium]
MTFRLRITEGKSAGKEFSFSQASVKIGRLSDNDLVLYDMGVSRYHCEIIDDDDAFTLRDTGSANGTILNETITTEAHIREGDKIRVGPVVLVFEPGKGPRTSGTDASISKPGLKRELFRPDTEHKRRQLEEQATTAFSGDDDEAHRKQRRGTVPKTPKVAAEEGRTDTGSFVVHAGDRTRGFRALPRSTRIALLLAVAVVLIGGMASVWMIKQKPRYDRSAEIFTADGVNAAFKFGAGKVDVYTPDRVNFQFDYKGGRVVVYYAAGGIEGQNELEMLVNGKRVRYVRTSPRRWTMDLKTVVPRRLLEPGMNVLTFDNTLTPATPERWGVARVRIEEERLPPPDEKKAKELFELGAAAYDTRSVTPQNLARSVQYYGDARRYLEALETAPPLLTDIENAERRAADDLQSIYDSYVFSAEKAIRFGDRQGAVESLRDLLRYFPDDSDPRHRQAKRRLTDLIGRYRQ